MNMKIENFNEEYGIRYKKYYYDGKRILRGSNTSNKDKKRIEYEQLEVPHDALDYIHGLYKDGYGLKVIGKHLDMSYTSMRCAFKKFNVELRKGRSVHTDKTRKFRSDKAFGDDNPWKNWTEYHPEWGDKSRTGISGKYRRTDGSFVWLRSTWEYVYAKWLDCNGIDWKYENTTYQLSDGTTYRPDFFIYKGNELKQIVEIKGYYDNRSYKCGLLKREYDVDAIIIDNIKPYIRESYAKELEEWKIQVRKNKNENKKNKN